MMIDYMSIGRRIAFYRKKATITQAVLSEQLGVTESYISQIERGSAKPSLSRLYQIAEILNIDIALLVSDKVCTGVTPINSEIFEIIKNWQPEHISLLTDLLLCADEKIRKPQK